MSTRRTSSIFFKDSLLRWIIIGALLGVLGGIAWIAFAEPAQWQVTAQGIILDEEAAKGRFSVLVTFILIGIVVSFFWGLFAGFSERDRGWRCVPVFALVAVAAALIAWQVGVHFGPPDPATVKGIPVGGQIPQRLAVDSIGPFILWPIFALIGLFVAVYSATNGGNDRFRHRNEVVGR